MFSIFKRRIIYVASFLFIVSLFVACSEKADIPVIDADLAYKITCDVAAIGPRHSGSPGAARQVDFICNTARSYGAASSVQTFTESTPDAEVEFKNIIVDMPGRSKKYVLVGCHYDTKKMLTDSSFSGANDGASGVGVLLAMIKALSSNKQLPPYAIKFVFFDGEECINEYNKHDGLHGSRYFADSLKKNGDLVNCKAVIIADMVGDRDLQIELPVNSDKHLQQMFLDSAAKLGYNKYFISGSKNMVDDHTPFMEAGVPAIDIIDFEYGPGNSWWHTNEDSIDKVDRQSLKIVGDVILDVLWSMSG
tara:strand:- start:67 stop:984 length:918 start_codon:yes stop_codon:yes gene_type:complete